MPERNEINDSTVSMMMILGIPAHLVGGKKVYLRGLKMRDFPVGQVFKCTLVYSSLYKFIVFPSQA